MLNSKMRRSMAWLMAVAMVSTSVPVSAAEETETVAAETAVEQEAAPAEVPVETAAPEVVVPETEAPETTAPETTAPETSALETAAPAETEGNAPEAEVPSETEASTEAPTEQPAVDIVETEAPTETPTKAPTKTETQAPETEDQSEPETREYSYVYTGQEITVEMEDGETVTGGTASAVNVGEYTVEVTTVDGKTASILWEIEPAELTVTCYYQEVGGVDASGEAVNIDGGVVGIDGENSTAENTASEITAAPTIHTEMEVTGFVNGETEETAAGYVAPQYKEPATLEEAKEMKAFGGEADNYTFVYADSVEVKSDIATYADDTLSYMWTSVDGSSSAMLSILSYNTAISEKLTSNCKLTVEEVTAGEDYTATQALLNAKMDNKVVKYGYLKLTLTGEDGKEIDLDDLSTILTFTYYGKLSNVTNKVTSIYSVGANGLMDGVLDTSLTSYTDGISMVQASLVGTNKVAMIAEDDLVKDCPLEEGVYTITANLTVLGKDNQILNGIQVYLGNKEVPPVKPIKYNGKLVVDKDKKMTLTLENFNEVFQIYEMSDGTDVHIIEKGYTASKSDSLNDVLDPSTGVQFRHEERINKLVLTLDNANGEYSFGPCTQSPIILDHDVNMNMTLQVNFDEYEVGFDESKGDVTKKSFIDETTGITVDVQTTETEIAERLIDAVLSVTPNTNAQYAGMLQNMYYGGNVEYQIYDILLKDKNGKTIDLSNSANTETKLSFKTSYKENRLWKINGMDITKLKSSSKTNSLTYTSMKTGLGTFAVVNNESATQYATAITRAGDASVIYSEELIDDPLFGTTEDTDIGSYKVETKIAREETVNGIVYYAAALSKTSANNSAMAGINGKSAKLGLYIPYDPSKNYYFVTNDGRSMNAQALDTSNNHGGYVLLNLLSSEKSSIGVTTLSDGLANGLNKVTPGNGSLICYILVTDKKVASTPIAEKDTAGKDSGLTYSGLTQSLFAGGEHFVISEGSIEEKDAGDYSLSVIPEAGYCWADGTTEAKNLTRTISKAKLTVKYTNEVVVLNGTPAYKLTYGGTYKFVNGEDETTAEDFVVPTVPEHATDVTGIYSLKPVGGSARNYIFEYSAGNLCVVESEDKIVEKPTFLENEPYILKKAATSIGYTMYIAGKDAELTSITALEAPGEDAGYTLSGTLSADKFGNNSAKAKLKNGYVWSDGTTSTLTLRWKIVRITDQPEYTEKVFYTGEKQSLFDAETLAEIMSGSDRWKKANYINSNTSIAEGKNIHFEESDLGEYRVSIYPGANYCWDETGDTSVVTYTWSIVNKMSDEKEIASTEPITANFSLKATDATAAGLTILESVVGAEGSAYMTNPNAPTVDSNEDKDPDWTATLPSSPVSNKATFITYTDGTMAVKVPIKNAVFTLQTLGTCEQLSDVETTRRQGTYGAMTSRIDSITIPVTSKDDASYVFTGCVIYPTLLGQSFTVPMTLTIGAIKAEPVSIENAVVTGIADATYTGNPITQPNLTVILAGTVTLTEGTDYTVTYTNNTNVGTATITITGIGNYTGKITKTFEIKTVETETPATETETPATETETPATETETRATETPSTETPASETKAPETEAPTPAAKKVSVPKAKKLTYTGKQQTGVAAGEGYTVTGNRATKVGSYKATATLKSGYTWADGTTAAKMISWSIAKASQKISTKTSSKSYKVTSVKKKAYSFTIGASADGKLTYKIVKAPTNGKKYVTVKNGKVSIKKGAPAGIYTIRVTAAATANKKASTKDVTLKINKLTQSIKAKFTTKKVAYSTVKKKNVSYSIGASAKGKVTYKVTSTPKNAAKYIKVTSKGKVTLSKKAPKGTYVITLTAKATTTYNKAVKTVKITVK